MLTARFRPDSDDWGEPMEFKGNLGCPSTDAECLAILGKFALIATNTTIPPGGLPLGDMFDVGRLISFRPATDEECKSCPCCNESGAKFLFNVVWDEPSPQAEGRPFACNQSIFGVADS